MAQRPTIFIAGSGGIGRALALLLRNEKSMAAEVVLGDLSQDAADEAAAFANVKVPTDAPVARGITMPGEGSSAELDAILAKADAILDCLPGAQAPRMARLAKEHGCHYFNLTEYVAETNEVMGIAEGASTCFGLQCGLAPGFINILGHDLYLKATKDWGVTKVDKLEMRVGALTRHAAEPHFYGWTWSPVGVATEYVKDAIAVRDYKTVNLPSLTERKTLLMHGLAYEEALTSGGAADLPEALAGKVRDLDYKTLRYPGHYEWIEGLLKNIPEGDDRPAVLQEQMEAAIPNVEDDIVIIYAAVEGKDSGGVLRAERRAFFCPSIEVAGQRLRAIQSTTSAGIAEVLRIALEKKLTGSLLQSQVPTQEFLNGPFVSLAYVDEENRG
ncbi:Lysine 6-dehydrogenase [Planctomycetes bacterium Poly30]|uniref:Lysine 6-dehydrogenase n=1 Tax=Saltatorellus ferox TaxID=2528018 RepID=A0A518EXG9_9BACT|nr:Lysine 6-dehydrogenase [Planctomycetes bacterium Poly30]